jgi:hypothetical protein
VKIAQVAPLYESIPPKYYGGTESIVSHLIELVTNAPPRLSGTPTSGRRDARPLHHTKRPPYGACPNQRIRLKTGTRRKIKLLTR